MYFFAKALCKKEFINKRILKLTCKTQEDISQQKGQKIKRSEEKFKNFSSDKYYPNAIIRAIQFLDLHPQQAPTRIDLW